MAVNPLDQSKWRLTVFLIIFVLFTVVILDPTSQLTQKEFMKMIRPHLYYDFGSFNSTITEVTETPAADHVNSSALKQDDDGSLVTLRFTGGRLGSLMFAYGTLYGIARQNHKKPYFEASNKAYLELKKFFGMRLVSIQDQLASSSKIVTEPGKAHTAHKRFFELPPKVNVLIQGYMQAYGYFRDVMDVVRNELKQFTPEILHLCLSKLRSTLKLEDGAIEKCVIVGIHCRRGDFATSGKQSFGHWPANPDYVRRAMQHHKERYVHGLSQRPHIRFAKRRDLTQVNKTDRLTKEKPDVCVRFLVYSDDLTWSREEFGSLNGTVIVEGGSPVSDMCMLSRSNHSIMTTGTFSWMSAFLANGHVTYQKVFARPGSPLEREYTPADYFPLNWIPL